MAADIIEAPPAIETPPMPTPPPTGEIHVTPAAVDRGPKTEPAKKESARAGFNERLRKRVKPEFYESPPPAEQVKPGEKPKEEDNTKGVSDKPAPEAAAEPPTAAASPEAEKPKDGKTKTNPWKLVDEYKARATKAEQELIDARNSGLNPDERKEFDRLKTANTELENEMRFVNYAKSSEYKTKYFEPYERAWNRALAELSQITVTDQAGNKRKATVDDLSILVNLGLEDATNYAEATFGKFATDAKAYRKEIVALWQAQDAALKEAREQGAAREKTRAEEAQKYQTQIGGQIKGMWDKANEDFVNDKDLGALFKPVDGDQDGNDRLQKGFELVDRAFSQNPTDPKLTPEERQAVIKRHAAVRLRAAAFGRVRAQYLALQKKVAALEKEIGEYKAAVPGTTGRAAPNGTPAEAKGMDRIRAKLQSIAH